ncbi:uncharacterized protein LOC106067928 isoform X2 [Biomphalaria glabrata]|uniref:Uncharacterized protein LOC106067928 isoform X2 n=1 Tax=Biomphalaria glabrata TaxID=6526 RepID=A0A9W2ZBC7_BIOGL|nr:uncharacterized protein LOC106067928 isoform X2 [Biomphalaria glabrata]
MSSAMTSRAVALRYVGNLLAIVFCIYRTKGAGTTYGNLFVVTNLKVIGNHSDPSRLPGQVEFFLYTAAADGVQVTVTFRNATVQSLIILPGVKNMNQVSANPKLFSFEKDLARKSVYVFKGSGLFGLCVLIMQSYAEDSFETFLAIPVDGWGKLYYLVSLESRVSAQFVTGEHNSTLTVLLRFADRSMVFKYHGISYGTGSNLIVDLPPWRAFSLSNCDDNRLSSSFTGTYVRGTSPFGVISGNCLDGTINVLCDDPMLEREQKGRQSVLVEMLPPLEQYGREFIPVLITGRTSHDYFITVAGHDDVNVTFFNKEDERNDYYLKYRGDSLRITLKGGLGMLKSNKGVLVMYVMRSACFGSKAEVGGPSFCLIVPNELFYHTYTWSTKTSSLPLVVLSYICIVIRVSNIPQLYMDGEFFKADTTWNLVSGAPEWRAGHAMIEQGNHLMKHTSGSPFGLYLYGLGHYSSYMHPAGFITSSINAVCHTSPTVPGDLVDNDCDKRIDEEIEDNKDDDDDGYIDEDLRDTPVGGASGETTAEIQIPGVVNGGWSVWTEWHCQDCLDTRVFRTRDCNNPSPLEGGRNCYGGRLEAKFGQCYTEITCPEDCPLYYWSSNCSKTCFNCMGDCRKNSGVCERCVSGFKSPQNSCTTACEEYEFGPNCEGDCMAKCDDDCFNRVTGECSDSWISFRTLVPALIPIIIVANACIFWGYHKQKQTLLPTGESKPSRSWTLYTAISSEKIREMLAPWKSLETPRVKPFEDMPPDTNLFSSRTTFSTTESQV